MVSAADLIEALQRRLRLVAPHLRRPPGEFPAGWQVWFASMHERVGAVTGASAESLVAALMQRPLAVPPSPVGGLTRWQAFSTLWRQEWHPPEREDRPVRWFAGGVSVLWHVFFGAMVVWLMYLQYFAQKNPPPEGETVVQIEFIGVGTPAEVGGGPEPRQTEPVEPMQAVIAEPSAAASSPPAAAPPILPTTVATETPSLEATTPPVEPREIPEPQPATPVEQVVAVSEPVPDSPGIFVLSPPTPRTAAPAVTVPELSAPAPTMQVIEIPAPLPSAPRPMAPAKIAQPTLSPRMPEVAVREVPAPVRRVPVPTIQAPAVSTPQLQSTVPQVRMATIPTPNPPAPAASSNVPAAEASPRPATAAASAAPSRAAPTQTSGERPAAATAGAGPKPTPASGGWPTLKRADDWGDAARNQPGAQLGEDGLYNSDGSVRLAETPGSAAPGNAPGTVTEEIADLDRVGTWLKRAPVDYEPTTFDKYWRPNETLLAEWVRRSIKTVRIPIPGTNKHIVCQTVLLALGGGCGISDPNLNNQPATARPPPDIPFKPELQEDNGSIRPSAGE